MARTSAGVVGDWVSHSKFLMFRQVQRNAFKQNALLHLPPSHLVNFIHVQHLVDKRTLC